MGMTNEKSTKCRNCGRELSSETKFCPECGMEVENSIVRDTTTQRKINTVEKSSVQRSAAGIIGIVGTIIACLGMFIPMLEAWGQRISYFGMMMDSGDEGTAMLIGIMIFVIIELFCFVGELNGVANVLGVFAFALFLYSMFGSGEIPARDLMNYVGYGFWVMSVGLIVMSISSIFNSGKK